MIFEASKMVTTDLRIAKQIRALYRATNLNSFQFAKKYFSEYPYRFVKNSLDFARAVEYGFPLAIKEIY